MPHKVCKLVVAGPRDSGKTSWSNIFHNRIILDHCIAFVTKEREFSSAMITNETQLVIVDEWSTTRIDSDHAKCILQGSWMVTAVKHGVPRAVLNSSPYYMTANDLAKVASILKYTLEHSAPRPTSTASWNSSAKRSKAKPKRFLDQTRSVHRCVDAPYWPTAEVFDLAAFFRGNSTILAHAESLRKKANVLVLISRCPFTKEMERQKREREGEGSQQQPKVPSQRYWTVVKNGGKNGANYL